MDWSGTYGINTKVRQTRFQMPYPHCHDYYEIYYLVSGERKIFIKDSVYYIQPGDVIMIHKNDLHKTTFLEEGKHERIVITFDEAFLGGLRGGPEEEAIEHLLLSQRIRLRQSERVEMERLLARILKENEDKGQYFECLCRVQIYECLLYLLRYRAEYKELNVIDEILLNDLEKEIQNVARHIYHYYDSPLTLKGMADIAGMSEHYFSKKFKRVTGFGFKEYLTMLRINHSKELLKGSNLSVTEIGTSCGFSDGNYFGDVFRREVGMSPIQYRGVKDGR